MNEKWDLRFMRIAREKSTWSKDPSTKCGAVIVNQDKFELGAGYNGFPKGFPDKLEDYLDRDSKLIRVLHAEENAILRGLRMGSLKGTTLYVYPFHPCGHCASLISQVGISKVITLETPIELRKRWKESINVAKETFDKKGIFVKEYKLEDLE